MPAQSMTTVSGTPLRANVCPAVPGSVQYGARAGSFATAPVASSGGNEQGQIFARSKTW